MPGKTSVVSVALRLMPFISDHPFKARGLLRISGHRLVHYATGRCLLCGGQVSVGVGWAE